MNKKIGTILATVALTLGSVFATATPAAAAGCTIAPISTVGHAIHTTNNNLWGYSAIYVKPAPGCHDIQVRNVHNPVLVDAIGIQIEWLQSNGLHDGWGVGGHIYLLDYASWQIVEFSVPTGRKFRIWIQDDGYTSTGQVMY